MVAGLDESKQREVVALGASGGEDDLCGSAVEQGGDALAGVLYGGACLLAVLMDRGCVAEVSEQPGTHGIQHFRKKGSGGVGVHVDAVHGSILGHTQECVRSPKGEAISIWAKTAKILWR